MIKNEFIRLVNKGSLILLHHNAETGVVSAIAPLTGMTITMRPDLTGLETT